MAKEYWITKKKGNDEMFSSKKELKEYIKSGDIKKNEVSQIYMKEWKYNKREGDFSEGNVELYDWEGLKK